MNVAFMHWYKWLVEGTVVMEEGVQNKKPARYKH
jgi:hypothetical protein